MCSLLQICWEQDVLVTTERGQISRLHHHNVNKKHRAREAQRRQLFKFLREKERVVDINSPRAVFAQREKAVGTKFLQRCANMLASTGITHRENSPVGCS